ncbi:MAG: UDP-4-amino-4,6-dideoxy-N-acetyl-beta-L-altrosami ne transaminase [Candidatus Rifleibacteriota bacterium]
MKFLPYGCQEITEADIEAVVKILKSDFLTQGPAIESFEKAFCQATGARFAIACSNGTAALHLAAIAAGIAKGDTVLVPPVTFVASANCARFNGADVVFADIDRKNLTMSPEECERQLILAKEKGSPIKAVVTVDFAGHPCDMAAFARLKKKYDFIWIQDACHALGATWQDESGRKWKIGEWPVPDMTVYSFHPVKHITSGEGGMITTHSERYAENLRLHRTHGITKDPSRFVFSEMALAKDGSINPWYYEMQSLGFNYRLTDMQAALGESQLKRLDNFITRRRQIVDQYRKKLSHLQNLEFPEVKRDVGHAYHLAIIELNFDRIGKERARVMNELREKGIGTQVHYIPVPMMPYYAETSCLAELPASMDYYRKALSIPCYPQMTDEDVARVCKAVEEVIS